jgi:hypothetical protein
MPSAIKERIISELDKLSDPQLEKVLKSVQSVKRPEGIPGPELVRRVAGLFSPEDAAEMIKAIEEDCENIDEEGW